MLCQVNQALALLTQLVISASSFPYQAAAAADDDDDNDVDDDDGGPALAAFVPPPPHLALAATLIVHPSMTTGRGASAERLQASNAALRLLHTVQGSVGAIHADFRSAFDFLSLRDRRGVLGRRQLGKDWCNDDDDDDGQKPSVVDDEIALDLATVDSVWTRAEDLWHIVGWAFNCSVLYPARWARWKLLLGLMVGVLEDDYAQRRRPALVVIHRPMWTRREAKEERMDGQRKRRRR